MVFILVSRNPRLGTPLTKNIKTDPCLHESAYLKTRDNMVYERPNQLKLTYTFPVRSALYNDVFECTLKYISFLIQPFYSLYKIIITLMTVSAETLTW